VLTCLVLVLVETVVVLLIPRAMQETLPMISLLPPLVPVVVRW
jgi:hypothetical protein